MFSASQRLIICSIFIRFCACAAGTTTLAHFPYGDIRVAQVDASGNIYIAGQQGRDGTGDSGDAFVAKLSPDGSKVFFSTRLGGSKADFIVALALDAAGAVYVAGTTQSADFPVTPGALQTVLAADATQTFVAKIDPQGKVVYSTLLGDHSNAYAAAGGIAVNAEGNVFISGQTVGTDFPETNGAPFRNDGDKNTYFVVKLNADGTKILGAVRGIGGRIVLDSHGSLYVAGVEMGTLTRIPVTPGAFQSSYQLQACGGTGQLAFSCAYQYVAKLNGSLTQLIFSTYLTGTWGAQSSALFVDAHGNVTVAGTTNSPDYPTTPDAFEPIYVANAPRPPSTSLFGSVVPPPATGFLTTLSDGGAEVIYSTFFGGTQSDTITFAALSSNRVVLSGQAGSADLPALIGVPSQCMPQSYVTRLSPEEQSVSAARLVPGGVLAYDALTATLLVQSGSDLIRFDPSAPASPVACILDAADLRPVTSIAPGELLSIYGARFSNSGFSPGSASFPSSAAGVSVTFNGIPGPLMYVSAQQINVQVPYEMAGNAEASVVVSSEQLHGPEARTLPVITRNPVVFLDTVTPRSSVDFFHCSLSGIVYGGQPLPIALNSDGSRNTCSNPAQRGSVVTLFLAGLGLTDPAPVTGSVNTAPGEPLNLPITIAKGPALTVVSAKAAPGAISGVWQVNLRTGDDSGAVPVAVSVDGIPVRDGSVTVWVR